MRATKDAIKRVIAGETVLVPTGRLAERFQGLISLNETGAFIWDELSGDRTEDELRRALLEEYDTTEECAARDLALFLNGLREHGLLEEDCQRR